MDSSDCQTSTTSFNSPFTVNCPLYNTVWISGRVLWDNKGKCLWLRGWGHSYLLPRALKSLNPPLQPAYDGVPMQPPPATKSFSPWCDNSSMWYGAEPKYCLLYSNRDSLLLSYSNQRKIEPQKVYGKIWKFLNGHNYWKQMWKYQEVLNL